MAADSELEPVADSTSSSNSDGPANSGTLDEAIGDAYRAIWGRGHTAEPATGGQSRELLPRPNTPGSRVEGVHVRDRPLPTPVWEIVAQSARMTVADAERGVLSPTGELLRTINCSADGVTQYVRMERQTLASLYFAALKTPSSPTIVKQLALRLAWNAGADIEVPAAWFSVKWTSKTDDWVVTQYTSPEPRGKKAPCKQRTIRAPLAMQVLMLVFAGTAKWPAKQSELIEYIESWFGGPPNEAEKLDAPGRVRFTYSFDRPGPAGQVRLFIDGRPVPMSNRADDRKLLRLICGQPAPQMSGKQMRNKYQIANVSAAAKRIRDSLESILPGAKAWLDSSRGVHWANGHEPSFDGLPSR
jgi:hypothetical protein